VSPTPGPIRQRGKGAAEDRQERQPGCPIKATRKPGTGRAVAAVAAAAVCLAACATGRLPPGERMALPLRQVADVPLPDGVSRFDYESIDPRRHVLYIAHLGASSIVAFNTLTRRVQADRHGVAAVHGVLAVPGLGKLFASATGSGQAVTISEATGRILARAPAGAYPDGIAYDPARQEAFVSDESAGAETIIDARDGHRIATIRLDGQAGNVQYDPSSGQILADVQTRNTVAVIDPGSNRVVRAVQLPGCDHDHGLYIDKARRLAFVACDGNGRLLVLDLTNFAVTQTLRVGAEPDVLAFDPALRRLYVAAESGVVTVLAERRRSLATLGRAFLAPEAHTIAVDPRTHLAYFALQDVAGKPVLQIMAPSR
jgi:DNA-binding beta-propeller fold protein YncE